MWKTYERPNALLLCMSQLRLTISCYADLAVSQVARAGTRSRVSDREGKRLSQMSQLMPLI